MSGCLKAFLIVLAAGAVIGLGSCVALVVLVDDAAEDVEEQLAEEEEREARDLGDVSCAVDDVGFMVADIPVTNNSSERSNYTIEVTFEAPDGSQLGTGAALVGALEPGQSTTTRAQSATEPPPDGQFDCRVVEVDRFSDET
ncbi:MAG: FxLYD domain-containing protein [Acidimicrobiia bacterium]